MKKLIGIIIGIIAACVVTYFGFSFYLSQLTSEIVNSSWKHDEKLPDAYVGVISQDQYEQMDWIKKVDVSKITATQSNLSYPYTVWMFNTATTTYSYSINDTSGEALYGCDNIKCTIDWEFKDGKWVVVNFTEE